MNRTPIDKKGSKLFLLLRKYTRKGIESETTGEKGNMPKLDHVCHAELKSDSSMFLVPTHSFDLLPFTAMHIIT